MSTVIYERDDNATYFGIVIAFICIMVISIYLYRYILSPILSGDVSDIPLKYRFLYQIIPVLVLTGLIAVLLFSSFSFIKAKFDSTHNLKLCEGELQFISYTEHQYRDGTVEYTCSFEVNGVVFSEDNYYTIDVLEYIQSNCESRVYYVLKKGVPYVWRIERLS